MSSRLVVWTSDREVWVRALAKSQVKTLSFQSPAFFNQDQEIGIIKKFQETRGKARRLLVMDLHHIQEK